MTLTTVNGSAVPPPRDSVRLAPLEPLGPVSPWPRPSRARRRWRPAWRDLDGDTVIRVLSVGAVLSVAAIAAVVSYSHIFDLAYLHHEFGTAARLLPVSVDGLIASASLALLHAARKRLRAPWMAYLMLWLGVGATVAANVEFGLPFGWLAAVIAAWPAVAFVGSVEMALMLARNERRAAQDGAPRRWRLRDARGEAAADGMRDGSSGVPSAGAGAAGAVPAQPSGSRQGRQKAAVQPDKVAAILARHPELANAEIAKRAGVSERTVERRREAARKRGELKPVQP